MMFVAPRNFPTITHFMLPKVLILVPNNTNGCRSLSTKQCPFPCPIEPRRFSTQLTVPPPPTFHFLPQQNPISWIYTTQNPGKSVPRRHIPFDSIPSSRTIARAPYTYKQRRVSPPPHTHTHEHILYHLTSLQRKLSVVCGVLLCARVAAHERVGESC